MNRNLLIALTFLALVALAYVAANLIASAILPR